ncbi:MAG: hypothetical protein WAR79_00505 [Melioribacteraceae bacterium]
MEIKKSDLKLEKFTMLACSFATIKAEKKITEVDLNNIPIDLDFDILVNKKNSNKIKIMLEVKANTRENQLPGYIYTVICEFDFIIKGLNKLAEDKKNRNILFTALPLSIAMVRSHLYNVSSNFPYGHYMLPSIDLVDLFTKKFAKSEK